MKIYSKFEYKKMLRFQAAKDGFLFPLAKILLRLGISANAVSISSGVVAVLSVCFSILFKTPLIFIAGIWLHLFLDGLDGSLARLSGKKPDANGLTMDLFFDSIGIAAVGFYVFYFNYVNMATALFFVIMYVAVNAISYIFAKTKQEYDFVVRPRIFVLIAITLDYAFPCSTTSVMIFISSILLTIFFCTGIKKLLKI